MRALFYCLFIQVRFVVHNVCFTKEDVCVIIFHVLFVLKGGLMLSKKYVLMMCLAAAMLSACSEKGIDSEASVSDTAAQTTQTVQPDETEVTTQKQTQPPETETQPVEFEPEPEPEKGPFVCDESHVKQLGRTWLSDDGILWCAMSATGAEFKFTGESLDIALKGGETALADDDRAYARYAVYVDGERVIDDLLDEEIEQVEVLRDNTEPRTVKVIKLSESKWSVMGIMPIITDDGAKVEPTEKKGLSIEFIGDSLTCGYGIDEWDPTNRFRTDTEDATEAFAYRTAEMLNADPYLFCISGWGVSSGYSDGEKQARNLVPLYYNNIGWSYDTFDGVDPSKLEYEHIQPDIIVINLGTNDENYIQYSDAGEDFKNCYIDMLKMVREKHPQSKIVLTNGMMDDYIEYLIDEAMLEYTEETMDKKIYRYVFDYMDWGDKTGAAYHPNADYSERQAEGLAEYLRTII